MAQYTKNAVPVWYSSTWYDTRSGKSSLECDKQTTPSRCRIGLESPWLYVTQVKVTLPTFGRSESIRLALSVDQVGDLIYTSRPVRYAVCTEDKLEAYTGASGAVIDSSQIVAGVWEFPGSDRRSQTETITIRTAGLTSGADVYVYLWGAARGLVVTGLTAAVAGYDAYRLTITEGIGANVQAIRASSPAGGTRGPILDGATIYYGDILEAVYTPAAGYTISRHTPTQVQVESDTILDAAAQVRSYALTMSADDGADITVTRIESRLRGAALGVLASGSQVYYADVLRVEVTTRSGYKIEVVTVNGRDFAPGDLVVVYQAISVVASVSDRTGLISIYNGTDWSLYRPAEFNGSTWEPCSCELPGG